MDDLRKTVMLAEELYERIDNMCLDAPQPALQARNLVRFLHRLLERCEWDRLGCPKTGKVHGYNLAETIIDGRDVFTKCPDCGTKAPVIDVGEF